MKSVLKLLLASCLTATFTSCEQTITDVLDVNVESQTCEVCDGGKYCTACDGKKTCSSCAGKPAIVVCDICHNSRKCVVCNGSGLCAECKGKGYVERLHIGH